MIKHSKGPWTFRGMFEPTGDKMTYQIIGGAIEIGARLIATAPELLQAVKDALLLAELEGCEGAAIDNYRRVIAKAEGKSND